MRVLAGQTLIDIAIQYLGSAESAFELAVLNGLSITDDIIAGQELLLPEPSNKTISTYYKNKGIKPATSLEIKPSVWDETFDLTFGQ
jgi:LysM repeat protein